MEISKIMASVIRAFKDESGKTLSEFSEELEISRSTLQEYLSGHGNPNLSTLEHLAKKLGTDVTFLITGSFHDSQFRVLLKLMDILHLLSGLSPCRRKKFAELMLELISLWEEGEKDA